MKKIIAILSLITFILLCFIYKNECVSGKNNDIKKLLNAKPIEDEQFLLVTEYENNRNKSDNSIDFIKEVQTNINNNKNNSNSIDVSEAMEAKMNVNNIQSNSEVILTRSIDNNQVQLLARLIESEAGDEPYLGKLAVGSVVINRTREDKEDMSTVIFKAGQFDGVHTSNFNIQPSQDSINAAMEVLGGKNIVSSAYFFANLKLCSPSFAKSDKFIARIGDHWFFNK